MKVYFVSNNIDIYSKAIDSISESGIYINISQDINSVDEDWDYIVIGNDINNSNSIVQKAKQLNIKVITFIEFINLLTNQKQRILIIGSNGKNSVAQILTYILQRLDYNPDYLKINSNNKTEYDCQITNNAFISIIQGQTEKDNLSGRHKFTHIDPHIIILTGIYWSPYSSFASENQEIMAYAQLLQKLPKAGYCIYNQEDKIVKELVRKYLDPDIHYLIPYHLPLHRKRGLKYEIRLDNPLFPNALPSLRFRSNAKWQPIELYGDHQLSNLSAVWHTCKQLGIEESEFLELIANFKLSALYLDTHFIKKLQQTVIFDIASSPSQVKATIQAVVDLYGKKRTIACLKINNYQYEQDYSNYANSLKLAAYRFVLVPDTNTTVQKVQKQFHDSHLNIYFSETELFNAIKKIAGTNFILLFMGMNDKDCWRNYIKTYNNF